MVRWLRTTESVESIQYIVDEAHTCDVSRTLDGALGWEVAEISVVTRERLVHQRDAILQAAARHGASNVRVFGSVARGDAAPDSDVDFLVDLAPDRTLLDLGALLMDLQDLLEAPVDVATEQSLRPRIRAEALRDAVSL